MSCPERYVLHGELGRGAHGVVYEASSVGDPHTPHVALKRLHHPVRNPFSNPARTHRGIHPHLVTVLDRFEADGTTWVAMELVRGHDVISYVRGDIPPPGPSLPHLPMAFGQLLQPLGASVFAPCTPAGITRLRHALMGIARGLDALHRRGSIHRDLRPANVRVTPTGRAVLLDVDNLLTAGSPFAPTRETGPVAWVAPELGDGVPVAPAHDWYALGVLLFEALTGDHPFAGSGADVVVRKQTVRAPRAGVMVKNVPDDLDRLCADLLETSPGLRAGAREVFATATPEGD